MEPKRIFLAGFLIILVWVFWQSFFSPTIVPEKKLTSPTTPLHDVNIEKISPDKTLLTTMVAPEELIVLTVKTSKFNATLSNERLGTFLQYSLSTDDLQHKGAFVESQDISGNLKCHDSIRDK